MERLNDYKWVTEHTLVLLVINIANIRWIKEKAREFLKNIYHCFINHDKAFHNVRS